VSVQERSGVRVDVSAADKVAEMAAAWADDVDRAARFPAEAIGAAADVGLLACARDPAVGVGQLARIATTLARSCGSTAMIWAMHQLQLACLVRHASTSAQLSALLSRIVADRMLIASVTSESGVGGDIRRSNAAVAGAGPHRSLVKQAPTVSYGAQAGAFLITARRHPDAAPADQVAVLVIRDQMTATASGTWDPMGMRGTCSPGFTIAAEFPADQVLAVPFADIAEQTMVPLAHILWSAVWLGLATEAFERARRSVRHRGSDGAPPQLAQADVLLTGIEAQLVDAIARYERASRDGAAFTTGLAVRLNALKLAASTTTIAIAGLAMELCGMAGYQERGEHSVARIVRDAYAGPLMVANHRLAEANAASLLVVKRG
jgi:acyl-CoA dehydrogenase